MKKKSSHSIALLYRQHDTIICLTFDLLFSVVLLFIRARVTLNHIYEHVHTFTTFDNIILWTVSKQTYYSVMTKNDTIGN